MAKTKGPNPNGRVIYEGPSMLDGVPIVVIATGFEEDSANDKTGNMIQTWILRQDVPPHHAYQNGLGASVCGGCTHFLEKTCYVEWWRAPRAVWECWHHGAGYAKASPEDFDGRELRLGSAGDPAAVPQWIWEAILPHVTGRTGYTHQWRDPRFSWLKGIVMASADGLRDYFDSIDAGWTPFLVKPKGEPDPIGAVHCAASAEKGKKTSCSKCQLCDGATTPVVIEAHGKGASRYQWSPNQELVTA